MPPWPIGRTMNVKEFKSLLQRPESLVSPVQTRQLEDILADYPYFQAARAMHLKGLKNLNSFKYNNALKITAAYTADRDVLFDLITSDDFLQNSIANSISGKEPIEEKEIEAEEVTTAPGEHSPILETPEDGPLPRSAKDADDILDPELFRSKDPAIDRSLEEARKAAEELELGKPLDFRKDEKYSFAEWLQLTSLKDREPQTEKEPRGEEKTEANATVDSEPVRSDEDRLSKKKKFEMIDRFIATNPKIEPKIDDGQKVDIKASTQIDTSELMTETLAKVYLEQGKYKKAIQAYRILSLKYPEKSSFFADRIKAVKKLQKEN